MLSKILSKEECAGCKFCCSFRKVSLWETPIFYDENIIELKEKYSFIEKDGGYLMELAQLYKGDNPEEEVACYFLDKDKGCVLEDSQKPFDCKIWPLRIMNKDGRLVIALTPTCQAINRVKIEDVVSLVKEGIGKEILEYSRLHPQMIKEYKEGFPILMEF